LPQPGEPLANFLEKLEWFYTIMFTIELAVNVIGKVYQRRPQRTASNSCGESGAGRAD